MKKCSCCNRKVSNVYFLDGKPYGYSCYKVELSLKLAKLEDELNEDYSKKCISLIEVFKNKTFKDEWNNNFKNSILSQWDDCYKLTINQFKAIEKKLNKIESFEYILNYMELTSKKDQPNYELLMTNDILDYYFEDDRLSNLIRKLKIKEIKRGVKFYLSKIYDNFENCNTTYFTILDHIPNLEQDEELIKVKEIKMQ